MVCSGFRCDTFHNSIDHNFPDKKEGEKSQVMVMFQINIGKNDEKGKSLIFPFHNVSFVEL